jgi:hypothetical protein
MKTILTIIILAACLVQAQEWTAEHYYLGLDGKLTNTKIGQSPWVSGYIKGGYPNHGSINITVPYTKYVNTDSLEAICKERGHIRGNTGNITLLANIPRYVDLPDRTIIINHDRNSISYRCQRCGKGFSKPVQAKPDTVVIWKK